MSIFHEELPVQLSECVVFSGTLVEEHQSLMELGVRPHSSTRLEMSSTNPTTYPLRAVRPPELDNMPDVITVRVQTGMNPPVQHQHHLLYLVLCHYYNNAQLYFNCLPAEGVFQDVVVEIERPRQQKAFLGGYRHQRTLAVYHHAAVQTLPKRKPERGVVVFSRETQVPYRNKKQCYVKLTFAV